MNPPFYSLLEGPSKETMMTAKFSWVWFTRWFKKMTVIHEVLECRTFYMLLLGMSSYILSAFTVHERTSFSHNTFRLGPFEVFGESLCYSCLEFILIHYYSYFNLRVQQARQLKLPLEIGPETFDRVKMRFDALDYRGPVALSCDDTKLTSGLRLYWDSSKRMYVLVGGTDGPLEVANPESVQKIMEDEDIPKGT